MGGRAEFDAGCVGLALGFIVLADGVVGPTFAQLPLPPETVEADISTRSVAVTSSFAGTEIIVFGAVSDSRQVTNEQRLYDVVVVVEGTKVPVVVRRKSHVGGIWMNTDSLRFASLPSFYAIASTRPVGEITDERTLQQLAIGFDTLIARPLKEAEGLRSGAFEDFKWAAVRLKQREKLFVREDYGVRFTGRGLFRTTIAIPANVPVGPLTANVFLFRENQLLSKYTVPVRLEREGLEWLLHTFATRYAAPYGLFAVLLAAGTGLLASFLFSRLR